MNRSMYVDMISSGDVTDWTLKPAEIKSIRYICDGKAAFVIYVQDQIFKYKGTANEGKFSPIEGSHRGVLCFGQLD